MGKRTMKTIRSGIAAAERALNRDDLTQDERESLYADIDELERQERSLLAKDEEDEPYDDEDEEEDD